MTSKKRATANTGARESSSAIVRTKTGQFAEPHAGTWQPGIPSPNPTGRPAIMRDVTKIAREKSADAIAVLAEIMNSKQAAAVARVRAAEIILERAFGKAPQRIVMDADAHGMDNPALRHFFQQALIEAAATIDGTAEPMDPE